MNELTSATYPLTQLVGLGIRTRNQDEMAPDTRKIPGLWEAFYRDILPKATTGTAIYGVYTNYESDHSGHYDLIAAIAKEHLPNPSGNCIASQVGNESYLKFAPQTHNEDPVKMVIAMWQRVWAHFSDSSCAHERAYTADFELYHPDKTVELYIAVK